MIDWAFISLCCSSNYAMAYKIKWLSLSQSQDILHICSPEPYINPIYTAQVDMVHFQKIPQWCKSSDECIVFCTETTIDLPDRQKSTKSTSSHYCGPCLSPWPYCWKSVIQQKPFKEHMRVGEKRYFQLE